MIQVLIKFFYSVLSNSIGDLNIKVSQKNETGLIKQNILVFLIRKSFHFIISAKKVINLKNFRNFSFSLSLFKKFIKKMKN